MRAPPRQRLPSRCWKDSCAVHPTCLLPPPCSGAAPYVDRTGCHAKQGSTVSSQGSDRPRQQESGPSCVSGLGLSHAGQTVNKPPSCAGVPNVGALPSQRTARVHQQRRTRGAYQKRGGRPRGAEEVAAGSGHVAPAATRGWHPDAWAQTEARAAQRREARGRVSGAHHKRLQCSATADAWHGCTSGPFLPIDGGIGPPLSGPATLERTFFKPVYLGSAILKFLRVLSSCATHEHKVVPMACQCPESNQYIASLEAFY